MSNNIFDRDKDELELARTRDVTPIKPPPGQSRPQPSGDPVEDILAQLPDRPESVPTLENSGEPTLPTEPLPPEQPVASSEPPTDELPVDGESVAEPLPLPESSLHPSTEPVTPVETPVPTPPPKPEYNPFSQPMTPGGAMEFLSESSYVRTTGQDRAYNFNNPAFDSSVQNAQQKAEQNSAVYKNQFLIPTSTRTVPIQNLTPRFEDTQEFARQQTDSYKKWVDQRIEVINQGIASGNLKIKNGRVVENKINAAAIRASTEGGKSELGKFIEDEADDGAELGLGGKLLRALKGFYTPIRVDVIKDTATTLGNIGEIFASVPGLGTVINQTRRLLGAEETPNFGEAVGNFVAEALPPGGSPYGETGLPSQFIRALDLPSQIINATVYTISDNTVKRGNGVKYPNRYEALLDGEDYSFGQERTEIMYLGTVEPEGNKPGQRTGNLIDDLPENIVDGIYSISPTQVGKETLLNWLSFGKATVARTVPDMLTGGWADAALGVAGAGLRGASKSGTRAAVRATDTAIEVMPDIVRQADNAPTPKFEPLMEVSPKADVSDIPMQRGGTVVAPTASTLETPVANVPIAKVDLMEVPNYRPSPATVPNKKGVAVNLGVNSTYNFPQTRFTIPPPPSSIPIKVENVIPNTYKPDILGVPDLVDGGVAQTVRRNNEQLTESAKNFITAEGVPLIDPNFRGILSDNELAAVQRAMPLEFNRYGSPIDSGALKRGNQLIFPDGTIIDSPSPLRATLTDTPSFIKELDSGLDLQALVRKQELTKAKIDTILGDVKLQKAGALEKALDEADKLLNQITLKQAQLLDERALYSNLVNRMPQSMKTSLDDVVDFGESMLQADFEIRNHSMSRVMLEAQATRLEEEAVKSQKLIDAFGAIGRGNVDNNLRTRNYFGESTENLGVKEVNFFTPPDVDSYPSVPFDDANSLKPGEKVKLPDGSDFVRSLDVADVELGDGDYLERLRVANDINRRKALGLSNHNKDYLPTTRLLPERYLHGTRLDPKIPLRSIDPAKGGGTHELGLGIYLTPDDRVAKASSLKFNNSNQPSIADAPFREPNIRTAYPDKLTGTLDLNERPSPKFKDFMQEAAYEATGNKEFARSFSRAKMDDIASSWNKFRESYYNHFGKTPADELTVRRYHQKMSQLLKDNGIDSGLFKGKDGKKILVVYEPVKLREVDGFQPVGAKNTLEEALIAQKFLDEDLYQKMPDNVNRVNLEGSRRDLANRMLNTTSRAINDLDKRTIQAVEVLVDNEGTVKFKVAQNIQEQIDDMVKNSPQRLANDVPKTLTPDTSLFKPDFDAVPDPWHNFKKVDISEGSEGRKFAEINRSQIDPMVTEPYQSPIYLRQQLNKNTFWKRQERMIDISHLSIDNPVMARKLVETRGINKLSKLVSDFKKGIDKDVLEAARKGRGLVADVLAELEVAKKMQEANYSIKAIGKSRKISDVEMKNFMSDILWVTNSHNYIDAVGGVRPGALALLDAKKKDLIKRMSGRGLNGADIDALFRVGNEVTGTHREITRLLANEGVDISSLLNSNYMNRVTTREADVVIDLINNDGFKVKGDMRQSVSLEDVIEKQRLSYYTPEDHEALNAFLEKNGVYKSLNKKILEDPILRRAIGKDKVSNLDDLIDNEAGLLHAVVNELPPQKLDQLITSGVIHKLPWESSRIFDYIKTQYELPFSGLNDLFLTDVRQGMDVFGKQLEELAVGNAQIKATMNTAIEEGWGVPKFFVDQNPEQYKKFRPLSDAYSDSRLKEVFGVEYTDVRNSLDNVYVPKEVTNYIKAEISITSSPYYMGLIGDVLSTANNLSKTLLLGSSAYRAKNIIGNGIMVASRGGNALSYLYNTARYMVGAFITKKKGIKTFDFGSMLDDTKRIYAGGTMTQKDVWKLGRKNGLLNDYNMFGEDIRNVNKHNIKRTFQTLQYAHKHFPELNIGDITAHGVRKSMEIIKENNFLTEGINFVNVMTDNMAKFSLLEQSLLSTKGKKIARMTGIDSVPAFKDGAKAVNWVKERSFMFDDQPKFLKSNPTSSFILPFLSFRLKNIEQSYKFMIEHPARFAAIYRISAQPYEEQEEAHEVMKDVLPAWMQGTVKPLLFQTPDGQFFAYPSDLIFPLGLISEVDSIMGYLGVNNRPASDMEILGEKIDIYNKTPQGFLGVVDRFLKEETNPIIKTVTEIITNTDSFGREITRNEEGLKQPEIFGIPVSARLRHLVYGTMPPVKELDRLYETTPLAGRVPTQEYVEGEGMVQLDSGRKDIWGRVPRGNQPYYNSPTLAVLGFAALSPKEIEVSTELGYKVGDWKRLNGEANDLLKNLSRDMENMVSLEEGDELAANFVQVLRAKIQIELKIALYERAKEVYNLSPSELKSMMEDGNLQLTDILSEEERKAVMLEVEYNMTDKYSDVIDYINKRKEGQL